MRASRSSSMFCGSEKQYYQAERSRWLRRTPKKGSEHIRKQLSSPRFSMTFLFCLVCVKLATCYTPGARPHDTCRGHWGRGLLNLRRNPVLQHQILTACFTLLLCCRRCISSFRATPTATLLSTLWTKGGELISGTLEPAAVMDCTLWYQFLKTNNKHHNF